MSILGPDVKISYVIREIRMNSIDYAQRVSFIFESMRFMGCTKGKRSVVSSVSIPPFNSLVSLYSIIRFYLSARKRKVATFLDDGQRRRSIEMATAKRTCEKGRGVRAKSIVNADSSCLSCLPCLHRGKGNSPGRARRFPRRFVCCRAFAKNHPRE